MNVKCIPTREMFYDEIKGYRIVACKLLESDSEVKLNKYYNFTLSGTNLTDLRLKQEANIVITPDTRSKYEGSYIMLGYQGVGINEGDIKIDPKFEFEILCRLMETAQARHVNKAYPRFVHMVLNGHEDDIDYHNIYNVGKKRLPEYINKVKQSCNNILFYPACYEKGIDNQEAISMIATCYDTPEEFESTFSKSPYHVYMDVVEYSFDKADRLVGAHFPEALNSKERCQRAVIKVLNDNEQLGDTRLAIRILVEELKNLVPEAKEYIKESIVENPFVFYDEERKCAALKSTYEAECTIADHIKHRLADKQIMPTMDWQNYTEVDGFTCTEEQSKILQLVANGTRIALLTGSAGCGKTSSMKALIQMLEAYGKTYSLLCPTGIASKRLREATNRPTSTIHMAIAKGIVKTDYVILEESSMVSVQLLADLLNKLEYEPNLVFICDEAQLASISCGNIVQDIIDSGIVPRANLTKVFRYGSSGLATIATDTRNGTTEHLFDKYADFECIESDDSMEQILMQYEKLLQSGYKKNEILILSPYNKGSRGTYVINQRIQKEFNTHEYTPIKYKHTLGEIGFKIGDRVLNTKNNYNMPCICYDDDGEEYEDMMFCANGDIGVVRDCRKIDDTRNALIVEFDNGLAVVAGNDISHLILGYAISCHKCITGETLILTNKGTKTAQDLFNEAKRDKSLMVYNGSYFEIPKNFVKNIPLPCKSITLKNGSKITGTLDHGLTTINADGTLERVDIGEIKVGDYIGLKIGTNVYGDSLDLSKYEVERNNKENKKIIIPNTLSEDLATFLGYMCADGTVYKSGFRFAKRNKEVVNYALNVTKDIFHANPKKFYKIEKSHGKNGCWYGEVNSTGLSKWLLSLGGLSPNNKYVPNCILEAPKNIQCKFLKGLFEDGTVNIKNDKFDHIEFVSTNEKCVIQVQNMLLNMGIVSYLKKYTKKDGHFAYHIYIYRKDALKFKDEIGFISFHKQGRLEKYLVENDKIKTLEHIYIPNVKNVCANRLLDKKSCLSRSVKESLYYFTDKMLTRDMALRIVNEIKNVDNELADYLNNLASNFIFYPVTDISSCVEETYCFEVPEAHQFIQNGFAGWNCQGSQSKAVLTIIAPQHKRMLSRNLCYVALSRAQEHMILISDQDTIDEALKTQENLERDTYLAELLKENNND